jgi:hypothetical protein
MPQLIKKIESDLINDITNSVVLVKSVVGELQQEDYINMGGFVAYLQNFTNEKGMAKAVLYYRKRMAYGI